ncbi:hypothetical protein CDD82_1236 [Ophiocordyceps australis]|uniref:Uncharacterized protein n=1 Tax=Ophiocordyceps australis TaxID=1399860 RepID=A0A2C5ZN34_9HYPO|nr:hypothetical protein CDD82_1236 [Ophiocordyceps australis]
MQCTQSTTSLHWRAEPVEGWKEGWKHGMCARRAVSGRAHVWMPAWKVCGPAAASSPLSTLLPLSALSIALCSPVPACARYQDTPAPNIPIPRPCAAPLSAPAAVPRRPCSGRCTATLPDGSEATSLNFSSFSRLLILPSSSCPPHPALFLGPGPRSRPSASPPLPVPCFLSTLCRQSAPLYLPSILASVSAANLGHPPPLVPCAVASPLPRRPPSLSSSPSSLEHRRRLCGSLVSWPPSLVEAAHCTNSSRQSRDIRHCTLFAPTCPLASPPTHAPVGHARTNTTQPLSLFLLQAATCSLDPVTLLMFPPSGSSSLRR